jgi:uncharacterized protein YndB with AHSA1/START domain
MRRVIAALVVVLALFAAAAAASAVLDQPATNAHRQVVVEAPRALVWKLLTDFDGYSEWNPYITRAEGEARVGATVRLRLELHQGEPEEFQCEVQDVKPQRKLRWRCRKYGLPGLLDREHAFRVLPIDGRRVWLVYDGRLEGLFQPFTDLGDLKRGYRRMTDALKEHAERSS